MAHSHFGVLEAAGEAEPRLELHRCAGTRVQRPETTQVERRVPYGAVIGGDLCHVGLKPLASEVIEVNGGGISQFLNIVCKENNRLIPIFGAHQLLFN